MTADVNGAQTVAGPLPEDAVYGEHVGRQVRETLRLRVRRWHKSIGQGRRFLGFNLIRQIGPGQVRGLRRKDVQHKCRRSRLHHV